MTVDRPRFAVSRGTLAEQRPDGRILVDAARPLVGTEPADVVSVVVAVVDELGTAEPAPVDGDKAP